MSEAKAMQRSGKLIRKPAVKVITSMSNFTIDNGVKEGTFPAPVMLGDRSIAWWDYEIYDYLENLPRGRCKSPRYWGVRRAVLGDTDEPGR